MTSQTLLGEMRLPFKKLHKDATLPSYAREGDAGMDLVATSREEHSSYWEYGTGLATQIPKGMVGLLFPRSSISKTVHILRNSVGVIDSGYRGEIKLRMSCLNLNHFGVEYQVGDRIGQLIVLEYPHLEITEVKGLELSSRGEDGFGSTGS